MPIWNLGSINIDHAFRLPHIPAPGETLAATSRSSGLGGKGANMSVASARAGARCHHIGAVGEDGTWARDRLMEYGVDTRFISLSDQPTGQAIIALADDGENAIILLAGANTQLEQNAIDAALCEAAAGDWLLLQNETNAQAQTAKQARTLGLRIAYAAAPFDVEAVRAVLPFADLLILNEIEMQQLRDATGLAPADMGPEHVIVTQGAKGARLFARSEGYAPRDFAALPVTPVDTTGAGDTFTGYVLAGLDRGLNITQAMSLAGRAAALMVTRHGTADVIPDLREVEAFRAP